LILNWITQEIAVDKIANHMAYQRPRLKVLSDYYEGKTKNLVELTRRKEEYMADNRVVNVLQ
jgi:hypothetical protein